MTRAKDISTTATSPAGDDYMVLDGATNGSRKILASNVSGGGPAATVVTGSRAIGTSYQNTSGKPMLVIVNTGGNNSTSYSEFSLATSPDNSTFTDVCVHGTLNNVNHVNVSGIVPASYYYKFYKKSGPNTGQSLTHWVEQIQTGA